MLSLLSFELYVHELVSCSPEALRSHALVMQVEDLKYRELGENK